MKKWGIAILAIAFTLLHQVAFAQDWNAWVAQVRTEALAQGISPETFDEAFAGIHEPSRKIATKHIAIYSNVFKQVQRTHVREITRQQILCDNQSNH